MAPWYRTDLFDEMGLKPATTLDEYQSNAAALKTDRRAGVIMFGRVGDPLFTETHHCLNNIGDGRFDAGRQPVFISEKGVAAVALGRSRHLDDRPSSARSARGTAPMRVPCRGGGYSVRHLWPIAIALYVPFRSTTKAPAVCGNTVISYFFATSRLNSGLFVRM